MTKVRTHKVKGPSGKTHVRRQHQRKGGGGFKLQPRRALANAKRSHKAWRGGKKAAGAAFATGAVLEILAFTVARGAGGILFVLGVVAVAAGTFLWKKA